MKEYAAMVGAQIAQVLLMIVSKSAMADGMSRYSFIFYSNAVASIILLPVAFIFYNHRSPPCISVICGFFITGLLGFLAQLFGYTGIAYSSATLGTTLLNLIPGFTFLLAVLFRMEAIKFGSSTTQAKLIGTVVSIAGAIIVTLYKGPPILSSPLKSIISNNLFKQPSDWVLGGIFLTVDAIVSAMCIISQAFILKRYPVVMVVIFTYCVVCTMLSALAAFIAKDESSSFSLHHNKRLISILYSGIFGSVFQVTVQLWCVRRKGPLFVAMFHPIGIVISTLIGVIFLGDGFYLGGLLGSIFVVLGFYTVMWGKAKEEKIEVNVKSGDEGVPFLQDNDNQQITSP